MAPAIIARIAGKALRLMVNAAAHDALASKRARSRLAGACSAYAQVLKCVQGRVYNHAPMLLIPNLIEGVADAF